MRVSRGRSCAGARLLADALKKNRALQVLDLSSNHLGPEGLDIMGAALLENHTLTGLRLRDNQTTDESGAGQRLLTTVRTMAWRMRNHAAGFPSRPTVEAAELTPAGLLLDDDVVPVVRRLRAAVVVKKRRARQSTVLVTPPVGKDTRRARTGAARRADWLRLLAPHRSLRGTSRRRRRCCCYPC